MSANEPHNGPTVPNLRASGERHSEAFLRLAWAENERRGGYFSSFALWRRCGLWLAAWVIEPEWLPDPRDRVE